MIGTGIDARVQIQQLIENQLPEFLLAENPKASDFLKAVLYFTGTQRWSN